MICIGCHLALPTETLSSSHGVTKSKTETPIADLIVNNGTTENGSAILFPHSLLIKKQITYDHILAETTVRNPILDSTDRDRLPDHWSKSHFRTSVTTTFVYKAGCHEPAWKWAMQHAWHGHDSTIPSDAASRSCGKQPCWNGWLREKALTVFSGGDQYDKYAA